MPLNPNTAVLLHRIETMPLATYQLGETVIAAGTKTGHLLILKKGAVTIRKNGTVIAEVAEPGAVIGELSALLNQPHTADVQTSEASEFRVAHADLLVEDPVVLLYVAAILAQRLAVLIAPRLIGAGAALVTFQFATKVAGVGGADGAAVQVRFSSNSCGRRCCLQLRRPRRGQLPLRMR